MKTRFRSPMLLSTVFMNYIIVAVSNASDPLSPFPTYRRLFSAKDAERDIIGVGGCTGGNCHGGGEARPGEVILHNEWSLWWENGSGAHFRGYNTLTNARSEQMAKLLYGPGAVARERTECLSCHVTDLPTTNLGKSFDPKEGVGCESCHGRAVLWSGPHSTASWRKNKSTDERTEMGFYDTRNLIRRAERCLECHLGTETKEVTHEMMAAGHPDLSFELAGDLFHVPKHWRDEQSFLTPDEGPYFHARAWAVGQAVTLRESMLRLHRRLERAAVPDFALFECYACHHTLEPISNEPGWRQRRGFAGKPGAPPWDAACTVMPRVLIQVLAPEALSEYDASVSKLQSMDLFATPSTGDARSAAVTIARTADKLAETLNATRFDARLTMDLLRRIAADRKRITDLGYRAAEQANAAFDALYGLALRKSGARPANDTAILEAMNSIRISLYKDNDLHFRVPESYNSEVVADLILKLESQLGPIRP